MTDKEREQLRTAFQAGDTKKLRELTGLWLADVVNTPSTKNTGAPDGK